VSQIIKQVRKITNYICARVNFPKHVYAQPEGLKKLRGFFFFDKTLARLPKEKNNQTNKIINERNDITTDIT
jgi:hypothetical protein